MSGSSFETSSPSIHPRKTNGSEVPAPSKSSSRPRPLWQNLSPLPIVVGPIGSLEWCGRFTGLSDHLKNQYPDMSKTVRVEKVFQKLRNLCLGNEALHSFQVFEDKYWAMCSRESAKKAAHEGALRTKGRSASVSSVDTIDVTMDYFEKLAKQDNTSKDDFDIQSPVRCFQGGKGVDSVAKDANWADHNTKEVVEKKYTRRQRLTQQDLLTNPKHTYPDDNSIRSASPASTIVGPNHSSRLQVPHGSSSRLSTPVNTLAGTHPPQHGNRLPSSSPTYSLGSDYSKRVSPTPPTTPLRKSGTAEEHSWEFGDFSSASNKKHIPDSLRLADGKCRSIDTRSVNKPLPFLPGAPEDTFSDNSERSSSTPDIPQKSLLGNHYSSVKDRYALHSENRSVSEPVSSTNAFKHPQNEPRQTKASLLRALRASSVGLEKSIGISQPQKQYKQLTRLNLSKEDEKPVSQGSFQGLESRSPTPPPRIASPGTVEKLKTGFSEVGNYGPARIHGKTSCVPKWNPVTTKGTNISTITSSLGNNQYNTPKRAAFKGADNPHNPTFTQPEIPWGLQFSAYDESSPQLPRSTSITSSLLSSPQSLRTTGMFWDGETSFDKMEQRPLLLLREESESTIRSSASAGSLEMKMAVAEIETKFVHFSRNAAILKKNLSIKNEETSSKVIFGPSENEYTHGLQIGRAISSANSTSGDFSGAVNTGRDDTPLRKQTSSRMASSEYPSNILNDSSSCQDLKATDSFRNDDQEGSLRELKEEMNTGSKDSERLDRLQRQRQQQPDKINTPSPPNPNREMNMQYQRRISRTLLKLPQDNQENKKPRPGISGNVDIVNHDSSARVDTRSSTPKTSPKTSTFSSTKKHSGKYPSNDSAVRNDTNMTGTSAGKKGLGDESTPKQARKLSSSDAKVMHKKGIQMRNANIRPNYATSTIASSPRKMKENLKPATPSHIGRQTETVINPTILGDININKQCSEKLRDTAAISKPDGHLAQAHKSDAWGRIPEIIVADSDPGAVTTGSITYVKEFPVKMKEDSDDSANTACMSEDICHGIAIKDKSGPPTSSNAPKGKALADISGIGASKNPRLASSPAHNWFGRGKSPLKISSPVNGSFIRTSANTDDKELQKENRPPRAMGGIPRFAKRLSGLLVPEAAKPPKMKSRSMGNIAGWLRGSSPKTNNIEGQPPPDGNKIPFPLKDMTPKGSFSKEVVDNLIKRLSAQLTHNPGEENGFHALGGIYYSSNIPSLEKSPTKDEKEKNPIAVCMDLITAASNESNSPRREGLLQMSRIMVDAVSKSRDAECAAEEAKMAAQRAEYAFLQTRKSLAEMTEMMRVKKEGVFERVAA